MKSRSKGKRLYRCQECGQGMFFSRREENRAARLRCSACGSARLDVSVMGGERMTDAQDKLRAVKDHIDQTGTGSVAPGSE